MPAHRAGYIAIVGRPNVGKSTLLNRLVGAKVSITSRKPQTTRHRVSGIVTRPDAQLVFVDTPGFQTEHRSLLNRKMNQVVTRTLEGVDVVVFVVEALRFDARDRALVELLPRQVPVVLVINKVDRVRPRSQLLPYLQRMATVFDFRALIPVCAESGDQVPELVSAIVPLLPEQPALYGADEITESSERFLAAELVREKIFRLLGEELPYALTVEIEKFETEGKLRRIHAAIIVDRPSQKGIVIGAGGEKLKAIGSQARRDMEELFGGKVHLELWVKIRSGWADDEMALRQLGYE
jgi:GTP-binding protein Era